VLLRELTTRAAASLASITDATVAHMRVSRAEASEAAASAIRIARGRGWVGGDDANLKPSGLIPRPATEPLSNLLAHIGSEAQRPITWSPRDAATRFMKDAVLGYLGAAGGRAARSVLGLDEGRLSDPERLRHAIVAGAGGIGDAPIERQICAAVIRVMDDPPELLARTCGQLSSFSFATQLASLSTGREMLRAVAIEKLYLDSNVFLPAIALGHPWHTRCASLLARCERHVRNVLILEGFIEEARIQYSEARSISTQLRDREAFFKAALARAKPNVFLDGFAAWASSQSPTPSFSDYCDTVGLGRDVVDRIRGNWSNVSVVSSPRSFGKHEALHARVQFGLSSASRHSELAKHEADQLALLASELDGRATSATRFVTAHARLREFVSREHMTVARAVVAPVALAHLLAVVHPTEIPPSSLRELAFSGAGFEVTETVFAVLIDRARGDAQKLRALVTEEVAEKLRATLLAASSKEGFFDAIDSRQGLAEVVMREIVPAIEASLARAGKSRELTRPPEAREGAEAASRLALEVLGDFRIEKPKPQRE
jgi:hypothetical protein